MSSMNMETSTPISDNKRSREEVSPVNPTPANPEKKVCGEESFTTPTNTAPQYGPSLHPDDIIRIAKELKTLMMPELVSVVETRNANDVQSIINQSVKEAVDGVKLAYEGVIEDLKRRNATLSAKCEELEQKVLKCQTVNDEQEQYSRRNCLRISGIPQQQDECTDTIVLDIAEKLSVDLKLEDIDRSHRVGSKEVKDIIVKFTSYRARKALISKRAALKQCGDAESASVYINEDLTAPRNRLLYLARHLVKEKKLTSAYSSDGKIIVIDNDKSRHRVSTTADLVRFA